MDISSAYQLVNAQTQANNAWSAAQAQKQMDFQERMSNTAHQREVADLKAAGLNPVLSAGGSGAATPSGSMGSTDTGNTQALMDLLKSSMDASATSGRAMKTLTDSVQDLVKDLQSSIKESGSSTLGGTKGNVAGVPGNWIDAFMYGMSSGRARNDRAVEYGEEQGMADTLYNMAYDFAGLINGIEDRSAKREMKRALRRAARSVHRSQDPSANASIFLEGL